MNPPTQNKDQISQGSAKNQPNQPEYKDKPIQNLQGKKNTQSKSKFSGSDSAAMLKSKQGQGTSTVAEEGCCG